jgi:hypothetical protein
VKLDFSATNFKSKVTGWRLSIENKVDTLFPAVCDTARGIAGIAAAVDLTQMEYHDPQILARANLASEDEDSAEDEKDNLQAIDEDHGDKFDEHHDNGGDNDHPDNNGVDDGNNNEDHNDGGDDGNNNEDHNDGGDDGNNNEDHNNEGDGLNGRDNEGIGSEEDEDSSYASLYCKPNGDDNDETEEGAEGSDLTEISSSSDVSIVKVAPASGGRRKGVQRRGH